MSIRAGAFSPGAALRRRMPTRHPWAWRPALVRAAALRAVRATIVIPGLFALAFKGFENLQIALFAGFGSFATLVLVSFAGTRRDKLLAHLRLAVAGSVLLTIGTAVNSTTALAVIVTVPVAFAVFFAGVAGPNAATATTGALLAYVLPAASPGTVGMIPDRLAGWWLASVAGTIAVLALPTPSAGDQVRAGAAKLADALADAIEARLRGEATDAVRAAAIEAKLELMDTFNATPFRPTGLAIRDQALSGAVELLEWGTALVGDMLRELADLRLGLDPERGLLAATAQVLRDSGALFGGIPARPDLDGLDALRRARLAASRPSAPGPNFEAETRLAFHAHALAVTALRVGGDALVAARLADPEQVASARARWFDAGVLASADRFAGLGRYSGVAARHASVRSVWFVNSVRGALALAAAVAVADATSVQHGFWVVLGTLSVLRTNASATGATALRALLGTVIGFIVGAALLTAIGTSGAALWASLPLAVLIASYAPGAAPFTVGQAAFTVTVVVLFNLLVPAGWQVGVLRVEDVALGCLVSVLVGVLLWPRGVAPLVGDDLADAYRTGAAYLTESVGWACGHRSEPPASGPAAFTSGLRLEEALRAFLAEQGTKHIPRVELWRLIGGTLRLRLTAHAVAGLPQACADVDPAASAAIVARADALIAWYERLSLHLASPARTVAPLSRPSLDGAGALGDAGSRTTIWLREHLDHLAEHLEVLVDPANHLADVRRRPWWR